MQKPKIIVQLLQRYEKLLIITLLLFVVLSLGVFHFVDTKCESTISILFQNEKTLNPLMLYGMAVNVGLGDQLEAFDEIIDNRSTLAFWVDRLDLDKQIQRKARRKEILGYFFNEIDGFLKVTVSENAKGEC